MKLRIKIGAASLAFTPMALYFLTVIFIHNGILPENIGRYIAAACGIFNFPAFLILLLMESYHVSKATELFTLICLMLSWSSFLAWFFWQMAGEFLGENEPEYETNPERAKYDWSGFQVRFVIGFIFGFLCGWRFVRFSTSTTTVLIAMTITGLFCGLAYGLYRPNFWSR